MADSALKVEPQKRCALCGEKKRWGEFYAASRWPDGSMRCPTSLCKVCKRAEAREKYRQDPESKRAAVRARRERIRQDPVAEEAFRRKARVTRARYRERQRSGVVREADPVPRERRLLVPIEPFREWLVEEVARRERGFQEVAELVGLDEANVRRWVQDGQETVEIRSADRVLSMLGCHELVAVFWPD